MHKIQNLLIVSLFLLLSFGHCAISKHTHNIPPNQAAQIVDYAQEFIGTPYRAGGKTPSGFDCSGFTQYVMKEHGIHLSASADAQSGQGIKVTEAKARPGDLLFFQRKGSSRVFHVGIIEKIEQGQIWMIHASSSRGVIRENMSRSTYWKPKLDQVRRVFSQ